MSFNATRLTCFALISSLETDCREAILLTEAENTLTWPDHVKETAENRAIRAREARSGKAEVLVQYLDFADAYQILLGNGSLVPSSMYESLKHVAGRLEELSQIRNRVAHSRPMEIGDLASVTDIANNLARLSPDDWSTTAAMLRRLSKEPAFVLGLTVQLPSDHADEPQHNLPMPDFDETGFVGRSAELKRVKKALLGPYPVVSILGDGGIGKSAIALKVAYDILDTPNNPFEAIVWASAKSTTLTNSEIAHINGAIQNSLGLFEAAARELAGGTAEDGVDPIEHVLQYLEQFKILLILDNLETVTDKRLRDFLLDLPNGSKVLLTSRIGLGIENPVKLDSLSTEESKRLLKTLAGLRSVDPLKKMQDAALTRLVEKLRGHPLYIKWLVTGVQSGKRPSELVNDNSLLLDFCMSNVWDKLSRPTRSVLQVMQIAKGPRSLGEISFLSDLPADEIQTSVLELMSTNFASMRYSAEAEFDGVFEIGEFASQYLNRHQAPNQAMRSKVLTRVRELENLGRDLMVESRSDPFNEFTIDVRDKSDAPAARILLSALRQITSGHYDLAIEKCGQATALAPSYGEVWRIQGLANVYRNDLSSAEHDFRRAYEYADKSVVMIYHYSVFLHESLGDSDTALEVLQKGLRVNRESPMLLYLLGRVYFTKDKFQEAIGACSILASLPQLSVPTSEYALLCLRAGVFGAEAHLWNGNPGAAIEFLEEVSTVVDKIGSLDLDEIAADWLLHLSQIAGRLQSEIAPDPYLMKRAEEFASSFQQRVRVIDPGLLDRRTGQLMKLDQEKRFGFLRDGKEDRFFHRNDLINREDWQFLQPNDLVAFNPASSERGPRADRLRPLT